jgi:hypothetical protein
MQDVVDDNYQLADDRRAARHAPTPPPTLETD